MELSGLKGVQTFEYFNLRKDATVTRIETFFNFLDASNWIQHHLEEYDKSEWHLEQCSINFINGGFRAGIVLSKAQKDLFTQEKGDPLGR